MLRTHRLPGQTLIELLIASAVIVTGLFAASSLVFSNLQLSDRDADEVVAVNLAREGVELAKQVRDSNWLGGLSFDQGLRTGTDYSATPRWNGSAAVQSVVFDFTANDINATQAIVRRSTDLATPDFYTQSDPTAPVTPWRRLVIFHPICDTAGGLTYLNDGLDCGADPTVGIRVESRIEWLRKGRTSVRTIYEDLFDWR
ncbi:MAG: hypothetical protein WC787_02465 [Patescibacteria group bacterium]|jgi:Tfp pilus assembly protein PilV